MADDADDLSTRANALITALRRRVKAAKDDDTGQTEAALLKQIEQMQGVLGQDSTLLVSRPGIGASQD